MEAIPKSGTILGDRYRLARVAWPTPIGSAWRAKDTVLDRDVLVYALARDLAHDARARDAFTQAAAHAAQMVDPHLAQVYDIASDPPYLVAEIPAGGRLAERLSDGPLPLPDAARVVVGVAAGLRLLHEHGETHGAVGPAWVGLDEEGRAKLLGTGLAGVIRLSAALRDEPPDPPLKPVGYPEAGADDPRNADVRSLAALALHMLTGEAPGEAKNAKARSGIPQHIARTIERTLTGAPGGGLDDLVHAFAPHAAPQLPVEREPGFLRTEGKWLFTTLMLIAIGVGAAIAGVAIVKLKPQSPAPTTSPQSVASPIAVSAVSDFDPPPGNGAEHPEQTGKVTDGDPASAWFTVGYKTAALGGDKKGVGLLFDLGPETRDVASVRIRSPLSGWQAEWRTADELGATFEAYGSRATFTAGSDTVVPIAPRPVRARYWLLWITRLTDAGSGSNYPYQAAVGEVTFSGGRV
ncbi:MAG: hypothetical protein ABR548_03285 [Actinomycetota bacterium]